MESELIYFENAPEDGQEKKDPIPKLINNEGSRRLKPDSRNYGYETPEDQEIKTKRAELIELLDRPLSDVQSDLQHEKKLKLAKDHPELVNYELYQLIMGSTPLPGQQLQFDTVDGQIEDFIRNQLAV